jgi:hypothetical protein
MPTRLVGTWENGTIVAELDYDASNRITAVRVINSSSLDMYLEATQISNNRTYGKIFLAGTTTQIPVGNGPAERLEQFLDERGRWNGISVSARVPA